MTRWESEIAAALDPLDRLQRGTRNDPLLAARVTAVKVYQQQRLRHTHGGLLEACDTRPAAVFLLEEL